jgi:hypothetical protein
MRRAAPEFSLQQVPDCDLDILQAELGVGAADVARIIPELRDRAPAPDQPPGDPEQERWRLFQSINDLAECQPAVCVDRLERCVLASDNKAPTENRSKDPVGADGLGRGVRPFRWRVTM